jgi:aryl-alcohol dehydrogenase-like predicted oxidoreductase
LGGSAHAPELGGQFAEFAAVAAEHNKTPQEIALAWLLHLSPVIVPIPGATKPVTVDSIVRSISIELSESQMKRLNATVPEAQSMYHDDLPRSVLR